MSYFCQISFIKRRFCVVVFVFFKYQFEQISISMEGGGGGEMKSDFRN